MTSYDMVIDERSFTFREMKKTCNLAFRRYRGGDTDVITAMDSIKRNIRRLDETRHPMVNHPREVKHGVFTPSSEKEYDNLLKKEGQKKYRINRRVSLERIGRKDNKVIAKRINLVSRRLFRAGIRFRRILSSGGMGMAALFETAHSVTGLYNKCVAKISLRSDSAIAYEKSITRMLVGAPHIVQMLTVDQLRALPGGYETEAVDGVMPDDPKDAPKPDDDATLKKNVDSADDVMLLEFLPFGSLDHWIAKADELGLGFSNEVCWHLLLCLAKACLAMKYPTACQPEDLQVETDLDRYAPKKDPKKDQKDKENKKKQQQQQQQMVGSGIIMEEVNNESDGGGGIESILQSSLGSLTTSVSDLHNIVHFDLDPTNVLVDQSTVGCGRTCWTSRVPKLKVADFGLAMDGSKHNFDDTKVAWQRRMCGKLEYYAPEQWTAEWEAITDEPSKAGARIAGQYSEKTNIYQIGLILKALMLRVKTTSQPYPVFIPMRNWSHPNYPRHLQDQNEFLEAFQKHLQTKVPDPGILVLPTISWMLDDRALHQENWESQIKKGTIKKEDAPKPSRLYEWRLREMVMRCTAYEPMLRPSAAELVRLIEARIVDGNFGESSATEAELLFTEAHKPVEPQPKRAYNNHIGAEGGPHPLRKAKDRMKDFFRGG